MASERGDRSGATHLLALDGVRGLAIFLVLLHHFPPLLEPTGLGAKVIKRVCGLGWVGVDLFFVLSGFLITRILLASRSEKTGYFKRFYMRRTLRIFPLYYATILFVVWVVPLLFTLSGESVALLGERGRWLLIYAQNIVIAARGDWAFSSAQINMNHFWSLAVEEHFYLVWPALVFFSSRRALTRVSVAILVLAPVLRFALVRSSVGNIAAFVLTPCRIDSMAIGGLLALAETDERARASLARLAPYAGIGALALFVPVALRSRSFEPMEPLIATLGFSLLAIASASLLAHLVFSQESRLTAAFQSRPLMTLGKYSYGLYVLHFVLRAPISALLEARGWPALMHSEVLAWAAYFVIATAASFGAALVTWTLIEKPALALKRYFEPRAQVSRALPEPP